MMFIVFWFELNVGKKVREIVFVVICCYIDFYFIFFEICFLCMLVMKKFKIKYLIGIIKF